MDDDLYQNAWSETTHTIPAALKDEPAPTWTSTKLTSSYGEEADLAAPSWSTGAGISWNEPSGSPGFSWSQTEPDLAWGSSAYEEISFGRPLAEDTTESTSNVEVPHVKVSEDEIPGSPMAETHVADRTKSPSPTPPSSIEPVLAQVSEDAPEFAAPPSPDGFGSFETGLPEESLRSPGLALNTAEADPWGATAWAEAQPEESDEPIDEWERARQEKAKQDRRVPPELLATILRQCEELGRDISPDPGHKESDADANDHAWLDDWRSGIDGVPGLTALMESFLPPLTLKAPVRFSETLVAKKMATSVKLTKNLALTKGSPMSHYLSAKGSTAWETSVKEQKDSIEDDIPIGWRIVEKVPTASSADSAKDKKSTGRLFSFWGRRQSQISPQLTSGSTESRSSSMEKPKSPVVDEVISESRRPSQDSVRSSTASGRPPTSTSSTDLAGTRQVPAAFAATVVPDTSTASPYASAPDPVPERSGTPPAPSAVSRFLNRLSRRNSGMAGSPRSSLALSSDDLEFLSDIVPSASDDVDEDPADALERFVNAKREPIAPILPPPLAPPPRIPPIKPVVAANSPAPGSAHSSPAGDNFNTLLGPLGQSSTSTLPAPPQANGGEIAIPVLPPPLVPSRPITPSATPGAGSSRASVAPAPTSQGLSSSSRPPSRLKNATPPISGFNLPPPPTFKPPAPTNPPTMPSKPKLSSPFPLPKVPASQAMDVAPSSASTSSSRTSYETAAESSPTSPTSALPLGALYPHLVTPTSPPLSSAQPMLSSHSPAYGALTPSVLATPLASAFSQSPLPPPGALAPPPQHRPAASPSAVPLTSNLFDDDDFSDFQSPVEPITKASPPIPPPIAKSPRTLASAIPNVARSQTAAPNLSPFAFPAPPPPAGPARAASAAPAGGLGSFDDDDFADFQTSPSSTTGLKPGSLASSTSSLFPSSVSNQALLTPKKASGFDDMGDFFGSTLQTPSPPRLPAKPTLVKPQPQAQPPLPPPPSSSTSMPSVSSSSSLLSRRKSHAAEHLHTLNLVEKAAARQGRWPAPPSPLPEAIPGPSAVPSTSSQFNFMDETPLTGAKLAPSFSSPAMLNPARSSSSMGGSANGSSQALASLATSASSSASLSGSLLDGWDFKSSSTPPPPGTFGAPAKPAKGTQAGGLSAQDLSFFEGL